MTITSSRGPGRPVEGTPVLVRLRPDQIDRIDRHASIDGRSRAAVVREAVDELLPPTSA